MTETEIEEYEQHESNPEDFDASQPFVSGQKYSRWQLEQMANEALRQDSRRELCRRCGEYGDETGHVEAKPQYDDDGHPTLDREGNQLYVDFPELECSNNHRWFHGEGKARGIGGKDPILFEEHLQSRKRREIYTNVGTPDPSIVQGIYNRSHPQGRKVNSKEQRVKNGASYYR